jgi:hypothetical protein
VVKRRALALVICVLSGCTTFEDPSIVLDLRIIAMTATLDRSITSGGFGPEQVVDVDFERPNPTEILAQLQPTEVCALVADPAAHRDLRWKMTVCLLGMDNRCDLDHPVIELGSGLIDDPDDSDKPEQPCATLFPDQKLLTILREAVEENPIQALGGIEYGVVMEVDDPLTPESSVFAAKHLRVAAPIPVTRRANINPYINYLDAAVTSVGILVPRARCNDEPSISFEIPEVDAGDVVTLFPVEPESAREEYFAPTLSGGAERLTETLTYQWLAAQGSFSDETTGGGHDLLGNQSLLGTEWRAPRGLKIPTDVSIWMVQRDERYGVSVMETCIRVSP